MAREEGLAESAFVFILPAPFFEVGRAGKLKANALEKTTFGFDTDALVFPMLSQDRSAIPLSLKESGGVVVVFRNLEPSCHEVSTGFDYLAHGAAMVLS